MTAESDKPDPGDREALSDDERPSPRGGRVRRRRAARKARGSYFFFILVTLVFVIFGVFTVLEPERVFFTFYSKTAGLLLFVVVVEYLVLKSMDRTRPLEIENRRLRELRRSDKKLLRRTREALRNAPLQPGSPEAEAWKARADSIGDEIDVRT